MQTLDPSQNYFELFGLESVFEIDTDRLQAEQQRLQAAYHPDRYASAGERERRLSVQMSSWVNQAFETLRDPVKRARYLLEINGAEMPDDAETTSDSAFLMEQMALREELDACRQAEDGIDCCAQIDSRLRQRASELARDFVDYLEAGKMDMAIESSRKMQFIQRIQQQLQELQFELEEI